ncbi:stage II sporulation protein M [Niallia taxi]|uniref:Stage II sporulation protein M n=1 Tax=Niallia taxi TaxID=2499688 RepID=A0A437KE40_9BACI|nr:stage II sporulation protein M [Niallia taxi]MCM3215472.1 stage II sporulation protein M [Niallia taxi]MDK8639775.1 stage II sporulation protein M [Niallia taxi]MED4040663.1 stage II sporulation protein M [Niallia taxi]MED4055445.1 stage II sporulation protein M [Niallia taxi]MED4117636.1 stage II sporulation protein M [Niallia taxi]
MKKNKYQNILANHFREHSSIYLFIAVLFLMGVIFGAIVVNSLTLSQKEDLFYYLSQFFSQISNGKVADSKDLFIQSFSHNSKFIGLMWLLGISIIGLPVILILLFIKGMVVGFTVGFLVNQMGWNGFLLSFVSVLPQNIIIIPVFIISATLAVSFSFKMIRQQFIKKMGEPMLPLFGRYMVLLVGAIVSLVIAAGVEAYISPGLMKSIVNMVGSFIGGFSL